MTCGHKIIEHFYTYAAALDISERKMSKDVFFKGDHDTKRELARASPAESREASKVRHVQETARREVDLG